MVRKTRMRSKSKRVKRETKGRRLTRKKSMSGGMDPLTREMYEQRAVDVVNAFKEGDREKINTYLSTMCDMSKSRGGTEFRGMGSGMSEGIFTRLHEWVKITLEAQREHDEAQFKKEHDAALEEVLEVADEAVKRLKPLTEAVDAFERRMITQGTRLRDCTTRKHELREERDGLKRENSRLRENLRGWDAWTKFSPGTGPIDL